MSSRASAGGAGGSGGVGQENRNLAWAAAYAVADVPLPIGRTTGIRVEHVGGQTGMGVDDVGVITSQMGFVLIQSKRSLGLDQRPASPLAKALDQVAEQYLGGVPDGSGREGALRPFDPDRDLLVITTDPSAPASVRDGLASLISNLVDHPGHLALSAAAHDRKQEKALPVLLGHLRRSPQWMVRRGAPPTDGDLRALFRVMRLEVLGLDPGQEQRAAAEVYLTEVLADRDQRSAAFDALASLGGALSTGRWWVSRQRVFAWLRDSGFPPVRDPRVYADVRELRARSDRDVDADLAVAVIDAQGGPVPIDRDIEPLLAGSAGTIVVVGPPGAGKTSIAARLAKAERDAGRDVAYLRAGDLTGTDGDIRNALSIAHNLSDVLAGWIGPGRRRSLSTGLTPRVCPHRRCPCLRRSPASRLGGGSSRPRGRST